MTIHIPPEVESSIQAAVHSGHFASLDAAMTRAAALLLQELSQEQAQAKPLTASHVDAAQADKPIWERIQELTADVPDEEWDKLPTDLAEQHDHYMSGGGDYLDHANAKTWAKL